MSLTRLIKIALIIVLLCPLSAWADLDFIGNQTQETDAPLTVEDFYRGGLFIMTRNGISDSITTYFDFGAVATISVRAAVYLWRGSSNNSSLIDTTAEQVFTLEADGWKSMELLNKIDLYDDSTYLITVWGGTAAGTNSIFHKNSSTGDTVASLSATYTGGAWSDPLTGSTLTNSARMSIYMTYQYVVESPDAEGDTTLCYIGDKLIRTVTTSIEDVIHGGIFTSTVNAQLVSIRAYHPSSGSNSDRQIKCAIYRAADSTLLDETEERTYTSTAAANGWHTYVFPATPASIKADTSYFIAAWGELGGGNLSTRTGGSGTGTGHWENAETYGAWENPMDQASFKQADRSFTIALFYVCPVSGIKGRRRDLIQTAPRIGLVEEATRTFAEDEDEIAK